MRRAYLIAPLLAVILLAAIGAPPAGELPLASHNDNLEPAGELRDGLLELDLEVVRARWEPMGPQGGAHELLAFAEKGRAPSFPGPLIRVSAGTRIRVRVTNAADLPIQVLGLTARTTGSLEPLAIDPGATMEMEFEADAPGTYFYRAQSPGRDVDSSGTPTSMLSGAFIVDPPGLQGPPTDRVLMINMYQDLLDEDGDPDQWRELLVINGRPWPHTERLEHELGDTIRWRVINASGAPHPMHLHGFYFRVDSRGDMAHDTIYWPRERRMAVTELLNGGETMSITWSPDRPGGWVFHCHFSFHVMSNPVIGPDAPSREERRYAMLEDHPAHGDPNHHVEQGMGGLMMAVRVRPPASWAPEERARRELRLFIQTDSTPGEHRRYGYVLQEDAEPAPDSVRLPGSTIVLRRGEPVRITVVNRTAQPTAVHWHGLELESYFDGVTGIGGYEGRPSPAILPGDSFHVYMTPPRAGSFMYHTHLHDLHQQSHGMYGALVVLEPDETWDPAHDLVLMVAAGVPDGVRLNGAVEHPPLEWRVGQSYRLRFMNITLSNPGLRMRLVRGDDVVLPWTMVAKDGWPTGPDRGPADRTVSIGETADFLFTPIAPFEGAIEVRSGSMRLLATQPVRVVR